LGEQCLQAYNESDVVKACQLAQDAQAGYACDYQCKRQPCGCNEVRECCAGMARLGHSLKNQPVAYAGKRYMGRLLCHAYNNGIVRSAVENRNLRAYARDHDVTFAESFRTCATTVFQGMDFLNMVEKAEDRANRIIHFERDLRNPNRPRLTAKRVAVLYGLRPLDRAELRYLSPYEFTMYWEPQLLTFPRSEKEDQKGDCHAKLTEAGVTKLRAQSDSDLVPGIDYVVKDQGGQHWVALEDGPGAASCRHEWVLCRRRRPRAPHFKGCPLPRHKTGCTERNATITMTYFHPWTLREEGSDEHVPTLQNLRQGRETWEAALRDWLDGNIICEESRRYVSNFISIHRLRPGAIDEDGLGNPDDMVQDEEVHVTRDMLDQVLETRIGGKSRQEDEKEVGDGHFVNSSDAISLGRDIWAKTCEPTGPASRPTFSFDEGQVKQSLQSARSSRSKENKFATSATAAARTEREALLSQRPQATQEDVQEWLAALAQRQRDDGRPFVNAKQFEAVAKVAEKVVAELPNRQGSAPQASDPLRWVVHGGPGTGKSHVVRDVIKTELFDQVLHWQQGLDYQIVALQAVAAEQLKGDTIHHACGIPVRKKGGGEEVVIQSFKDVAEQSLYWKWLLVDEFGMVGASLLADMDVRLRDAVVDVNPRKRSSCGHAHPFGGLNVLLSGDLWQLPPPSGGFLGNIPAEFIANARRYSPKVTISHGQSLLWGGTDNHKWAFHGMTELTESERCREDAWLQEVQLEIRQGRLSSNSHAFLHGGQTTVCGSWTNGQASCKQALCHRMSVEASTWEDIVACERSCSICSESRSRRRRVAHDAGDSRFYDTKFVDAPAIFPNNDIKYDVNKQRARQYAAQHALGTTWVKANDRPKPQTLQDRPDLVLQKVAWLSRHDRECGDLYGLFPLIAGLPVALTDHLDRSPDKQLLRGKVGTIHSWKLSDTEDSAWEDDVRILHEFPEVVYVKFANCSWQIEGAPEPGVYPVPTVKRDWHLDKGRQYPQLAIQREQLPLVRGLPLYLLWYIEECSKQSTPTFIATVGNTHRGSSCAGNTRTKRHARMHM